MQNNILSKKGDILIVTVDTPIVPEDTTILGYFIHLEGILDRLNIVSGEFCILPVDRTINEEDKVWHFLDKQTFDSSEDKYFCDICNSQTESYYISFRLTKVEVYPENVELRKISLKISNKKNDDGSYGDKYKYPYYERSIFRKNNKLYSSDNLKWTYNVRDKANGTGMLPTFMCRDCDDYSTFWEWVAHFFAIIVTFARQFKDISKNEDLLIEYLRQKDVYANTQISIYEILEITPDGMVKYIRPIETIFNVYEEFRLRGTKDTRSRIQTLLESVSNDLFYSDYIPRSNSAWYLNRYSPISTQLTSPLNLLSIDTFQREYKFYNADLKLFDSDIGLSLNYLDFNENNSITINFPDRTPRSIAIYVILRSTELGADIYNLSSIIKYSKVNNEITYNKGVIFIEDINPNDKSVTIPLRYKYQLFSKLTEGELFDTSAVGRNKDSYFFEDKITIDGKEYTLDKIAIRQIAFYNTVIPSAFQRSYENSTEELLQDSFQSIFLRNTDTNNSYYVGSFSTSHEEQENNGTIFKAKLEIFDTETNQAVCGFDLETPTPRDGYIELDERNGSGITGMMITTLSYEEINVGIVNNFYFRISSNEQNYETTIDYNLQKLPFNLNFLNGSYYWLNYIKNNSPYAFETVSDLITQKFMPYNAKIINIQNDKVTHKILPLQFISVTVTGAEYHGFNNMGSISVRVTGGVGPYTFYLLDVEGNILKEQLSNGNFIQVQEGEYSVKVVDNVGTEIIRKNIYITSLADIIITTSVRVENGETVIYARVVGGRAPYYLHYQTIGPNLDTFTAEEIIYNSNETKLHRIPYQLNRDLYIYVSDEASFGTFGLTDLYYVSHKVILETAPYIRLQQSSLTLSIQNLYMARVGVSSNTNWTTSQTDGVGTEN